MQRAEIQHPSDKTAVILFDGVCNLCSGFVDFILKRDAAGVFHFAALQSEAGQELTRQHGLNVDNASVILLSEGKAFLRSDAVLRVLLRLPFRWRLFYPCIVIPRFIRDAVYDFIARRRYLWFGRRDSCRVLSREKRARSDV